MKLSCEIVRDVLPLYAENMTSAETSAAVSEHLEDCAECSALLSGMKSGTSFPEDDGAVLKGVNRKLKNKRLITALLAVCLTLFAAFVLTAWLTSPEYLPYTNDTASIYETNDGYIVADFEDEVCGYKSDLMQAESDTGYICIVTVYSRVLAAEPIGDVVLNPGGEKIVAVYYSQANGGEDMLIYGEDQFNGGGIQTLPRLFLGWYLMFAIAALAVSLIILLVFRKNRQLSGILTRIACAPLAYIVAHLCVMGFTTVSYSSVHDFCFIALIAMVIFGILWALTSFARAGRKAK